jgi:amino acid transporter
MSIADPTGSPTEGSSSDPPDPIQGRGGLPHSNMSQDSSFDAGALQDDTYLEQLGYKPELNRALGSFSSFAVQFSMIAVGSSIFTTLIVGLGYFGPASFWSFLVGGGGQMLVGLAIAELVSCYPLAGGVYQIVNRVSHKPFWGFISGWFMVIAHVFSLPAIAVGMAPYVAGWFGWHLDSGTTRLVVMGIILLVTVVNLMRVKVAAFINNLGVAAELIGFIAVLIVLIVVSHPWHSASIFTNTAHATVHTGMLKGFAFSLILPAYIISSFDSTGNAAEETRDAARRAPRTVVAANFASYAYGVVGIGLLLLSIKNVAQVQSSAEPVKLIVSQAAGNFVATGYQDLAVVALFAGMVMLQLTAARVIWSQARDGQIPGADRLKRVNRSQIPHVAVGLTVVLSAVVVIWSSLLTVLTAVTALAWAVAYLIACVFGYMAHRQQLLPKHPWGYGRYSKAIFVGAIIWSVVLCVALIWSNPKQVGLGGLGAVAVCVLLWFLIPSSRRGKVTGVTDLNPLESGAGLTD